MRCSEHGGWTTKGRVRNNRDQLRRDVYASARNTRSSFQVRLVPPVWYPTRCSQRAARIRTYLQIRPNELRLRESGVVCRPTAGAILDSGAGPTAAADVLTSRRRPRRRHHSAIAKTALSRALRATPKLQGKTLSGAN